MKINFKFDDRYLRSLDNIKRLYNIEYRKIAGFYVPVTVDRNVRTYIKVR